MCFPSLKHIVLTVDHQH